MKEKLERTKTITIKGDKFTFDISKVSIDHYILIMNEKVRITDGFYGKIATSPLLSSFNAANIIDMVATFRVLMPEIEKTVNGGDFSKLNIFDAKELINVYVKEFSPWYSAWMQEFESPNLPELEEENGEEVEK